MTVSSAIEDLNKSHKHLIALPNTSAYDEITDSYFSELERELKPACYLTPSNPDEVSDIVKILKFHVDGLQSKVAICGSGQQTVPKIANVRNGITIHMGKIRGIRLNEEEKTVSIAAGEQMGKVYETLRDFGLGVVGNRHSSGGIGGDAVQGGLSYFSYARGFICDDVLEYEVVLANGEIVMANARTHSDLWNALKGGGCNFGIVTRFKLKVFEQGLMWGGKLFYFENSFSGQIQSLVDYLRSTDADTNVHICLSIGFAAAIGTHLCMNDIFSKKPEKPRALDPFANVQPQVDQMNTLRVDSLKGLTTESFGGASRNRVVKMSTTVKTDTSILEHAVDVYRSSFEKLKDVKNILFSLTFESISVPMMRQSIARGGNSLGLDPTDGPLIIIMFYTSWDNSVDDELVFNIKKEALATINRTAESKNLTSSYRYMSYASPTEDVIGSYGPESKAKLQSVSAKYDPHGFWQNVGSVPFKLVE